MSLFGVIPKKHRKDKWQLIVALSSPKGFSVNDAIPQDLCSVAYSSVDDAVQPACTLGQGCLLAKLDLKEAYRAVPLHPSDQPRLGMAWQGTTNTDRVLPFGLWPAPKIFSALTDAIMWILWNRGIVIILMIFCCWAPLPAVRHSHLQSPSAMNWDSQSRLIKLKVQEAPSPF